jgi:hypothetical protein
MDTKSANDAPNGLESMHGTSVIEPASQFSELAITDGSDNSDATSSAPCDSRASPVAVPRPELGVPLDNQLLESDDEADDDRTAEIAANAPRYRRKSSTFIDGIHDTVEDTGDRAPAQLYSTMSGRLFHSGRIAIVMVGLPARGKT